MNFLFVQLPIPTLVPQRNVGNHLLASSSLIQHLHHFGPQKDTFNVLSQAICTRSGDNELIDHICLYSPDVIAFTCTVWNIERTLFLSERLKRRLSSIKIWLGGPEIADDSYFLHDNNPVFDLAIEGEGEELFRLLVNGINPLSLKRVYVPGKITGSGVEVPLMTELNTIHDPFINGFALMEPDNVVVTELFRGCRYGCRFCRYHSGVKGPQYSMRPYKQIKSLFEWSRKNHVKELFLLDPSFEQRPDIDNFLTFLADINKPVIPIFAELRAEFVNRTFAEKLFNAGVRHVETGLQTLTPKALANVKRSFSKDKFSSGIGFLKSSSIQIRTDIMTGLPGDTPENFEKTLRYLQELELSKSAQVFRTQVLPGTELRKLSKQMGVVYEQRPPYQILSTPQWSASELENSINNIESLLDISCLPEERPLIISCQDDGSTSRYFPETKTVYWFAFDCTKDTGRKQLCEENFSRAAFTTTLFFKLGNLQHSSMLKDSIKRHIQQNPFSSTIIGLHLPPQFPLDIHDSLSSVLQDCNYSNYLQSLFSTTYSRSPHRRVVTCLDMIDPSKYSELWLEDLREISEIAWLSDASDFNNMSVFENYPLLEKNDYCQHALFSRGSLNNLETLFASIKCSCVSEQYIFPDLEVQWNYLEYSESKGAQ
jgi:radical SAM superfamily enzyme YgiQ (UPF0313 family)